MLVSQSGESLIDVLRRPIGYMAAKAYVNTFGSLRQKERWGCLNRPFYAYGMLRAADLALFEGKQQVTVCEFGVARGDGLLNMLELAEVIGPALGLTFRVIGFDTGAGLPRIVGYKDHPEMWIPGDFSMGESQDDLRKRIGGRAVLVIGDIEQTIDGFTATLTEDAPLGFISIDVDTYSSTVSALRCLAGRPELYTLAASVYLDDINGYTSSRWSGELAGVAEFNDVHMNRKIDRDRTLPGTRPSGRMPWHAKMFTCHVFDHPIRMHGLKRDRFAVEDPFRVLRPLFW